MAGGRIFVQYPFVYRFIDKRNRGIQQLRAGRFVVAGDRRAKLFDRSAQLTAVTSIDLITLRVLADAFFC